MNTEELFKIANFWCNRMVNETGQKMHIFTEQGLKSAMEEILQVINKPTNIPLQGVEKLYIKVGDFYTELNEYLTDCFVVTFGQEYQLQISNIDGQYKVTNGVNGWGNNCLEEFKDAEVKILSKWQAKQTEEQLKQNL